MEREKSLSFFYAKENMSKNDDNFDTSKKYVYALDLSLNSTGIALFTTDGTFVKTMTINTRREKETKLKLKKIGDTFLELINKYCPKTVVIERGFSRYNKSTQAIFKVHGITNYLFCEYEQLYYPSSSIKKTITGKGNVSKKILQDKLLSEHPVVCFKNFDESDAFGIGKTYFMEKGIKINAEKNL
jgi:Holliday junction resolvasome RuvABC endonuclease subunit